MHPTQIIIQKLIEKGKATVDYDELVNELLDVWRYRKVSDNIREKTIAK